MDQRNRNVDHHYGRIGRPKWRPQKTHKHCSDQWCQQSEIDNVYCELCLGCIEKLTELINSVIRLSYFPKRWKRATIVTIPKPRKPQHLPENKRPISLLSTMAKVAEKLIMERLLAIIHPMVPGHQYGYQREVSMTQAIIQVIDFCTRHYYHRHPPD